MIKNFSTILRDKKIIKPNVIVKRNLFIGTPVIEKQKNYINAGLGIAVIMVAVNKQDNKLSQIATASQAYNHINDHIIGNKISGKTLVESANILGYYGCHAEDNKKFFRGEKISQDILDEMNNSLGQVVELKKNTSVTTTKDIAEDFSDKGLIDKILQEYKYIKEYCGVFDIKLPNSIIYEINIPQDFKFVKIPNDLIVELPYSENFITTFKEDEYVLPQGTLIKVTKSDNHYDDDKHHYTIHVLSHSEIKDYLKNQGT